ncbi:MAG: HEAT repeat domain-containing protein, partial [Candidatus Aminicenantes bacterium]|nr:HEAT repeat domain-containing protein [Candidatus Aminicenantes bacterium]
MRRFIGIATCLTVAGLCLGGPAQDVISDLFKIPAPLPVRPLRVLPIERPVEQVPAEDAPLAILADYWARHPAPDAALDESPEFAARFNREPMPSERIRHRLLEAGEADPGILARLLSRLPETPASYDRIKSLLDTERGQPRYGENWSKRVERFLMFHSRYFRQELTRAAREAHDEEYKVKGAAELEALAKLDWAAAEPILKTHAEGGKARTAALSLALIYGHHIEAGAGDKARPYRDMLMRIVEDRSALGYARNAAARALLSTRWKGREAWYESLFHDPTLRDLMDGYNGYAPLGRIDMPAEEWVRLLARLAGGADRPTRDAAVSCLVGIEDATRDTLLPLLPWLDDPGWSAARDRGMFIAKLARVHVPEAVPGLIAVIERENDRDGATAARVMASYPDQKAGPALRRLLEKETEGRTRMDIIKALVACGGVTEDEAVSSVEAYAEEVATQGTEGELRVALPMQASGGRTAPSVLIGMYLAEFPLPGEAVARRLLERARSLGPKAPQVAAALREVLADWPAQVIDQELATLIADDAADTSTITIALRRRDSMRLKAIKELEKAAASGGIAAGAAALLLGEPGRIDVVLSGPDLPAKRTLLACARLVGERLPVPLVGKLLRSGEAPLAKAAEAYLTAEDSPEARQLVLALHDGQAVILGESMPDLAGHSNLAVISGLEKQLQEEARAGLEIYALLSAGYWGDDGQIVLRIGPDSAELTYVADPARDHLREIPKSELAEFR